MANDGSAALNGIGDDAWRWWQRHLGRKGLDARWRAGESTTGTRRCMFDLGLITVVLSAGSSFAYIQAQSEKCMIRHDATYIEFAMSSAAIVTRRLAVFATFWISFGMTTAASRLTGLSEVVVVEVVVVRRL